MNILERIKKLEQESKYFRIIDSEDIIAEDTGMGVMLHLEDPFEDSEDDGDTYKGYFKVIQTADNKIKIVDGMDEEAANCGNVSVNKLALAPVTATELTITGNAFIYLQCLGVYTLGVLTSSTNTIVQYATEQSWETGKEKELISRVIFADNKISDFSNEPVSSRVDIKRVC